MWHLDKAEIIKNLDTDIVNGLSNSEVDKRLITYGKNATVEKAGKTMFQRLLEQFKDFMVIILLIAALVSAVVTVVSGENEWLEPIVIIGIVILNAVLGVVQESKAEAALAALKKLSAPHAKVIRDGATITISASELVPGDIIVLEAGDFIPADARLIESASLKSEEASLTGESVPSEKDADALPSEKAGIGDRKNMVYSGCSITYGRAKAVVTATGMNTEMGKIANLLTNTSDAATPLQVKLSKLGKTLGLLVLGICVFIFIVGIFLVNTELPINERIMEMFMTSVSLAVSAIPEGLPAIVTVVLAIGVQRMVKKNAIIRRLPAVETLGSASVICSDKTGTLTQNRMTLVKVFDGDRIISLDTEKSEKASNVLFYGTLCCDGDAYLKDGELILTGDPTETAISAALLKYTETSKQEVDKKYIRQGEIPFDSDRKLMTTINYIDGKLYAIVKGAPDIIISRCKDLDSDKALEANSAMAHEALRVLGVAYKPLSKMPEKLSPDEIEQDLIFCGLVGMIDPPRKEAQDAIKICQKAGIRVIMITGDHIETATAIAKQLGILNGGKQALEGKALAALSDEELEKNIENYAVYARVSPQDKIRIVQMWQKKNHVVAMTGDGVNDAPALKAADIGCAMGITGTDVAKGAAAMTLTDDNFATIVSAVKEGRGIYDNIKKSVSYLISCNLGEVIAIFLSIILGLFIDGFTSPLTPIMLLWINLVTDSLPALALGVEPIENDVMDKKPRHKNESILGGNNAINALWQGFLIAILTLTAFYIGLRFGGLPYGRSMAFAVLGFSQLVHSLNLKTSKSAIKAGLFKNKYLNGAIIVSALIMLVSLLTPLKNLFEIPYIDFEHWFIIIALSVIPFIVSETVKLITSLVKKNKKQSTEA